MSLYAATPINAAFRDIYALLLHAYVYRHFVVYFGVRMGISGSNHIPFGYAALGKKMYGCSILQRCSIMPHLQQLPYQMKNLIPVYQSICCINSDASHSVANAYCRYSHQQSRGSIYTGGPFRVSLSVFSGSVWKCCSGLSFNCCISMLVSPSMQYTHPAAFTLQHLCVISHICCMLKCCMYSYVWIAASIILRMQQTNRCHECFNNKQ
jgi:hypothetical protein